MVTREMAAAIIDLNNGGGSGHRGNGGGLLSPAAMAVVPGTAETAAAIIELLMATVPGTGAKVATGYSRTGR